MTSISHSSHKLIETIRTLGPQGTNCEAAANHYSQCKKLNANILLHKTLEEAVSQVIQEPRSALLGCVVYPQLHDLVFPYLRKLRLADVFLFDTFNMVLAKRPDTNNIRTVATHPAPQALVASHHDKKFVSSNSEAALCCDNLEADACITTLPAAKRMKLAVIHDFGKVPMGFTIHVHEG